MAEGRPWRLPVSILGALAVLLTLLVNLGRGYPIASLVAAITIAGALYALWVRAGRPRGVSEAERLAEVED